MATLKNITSSSLIALLVSACGAKSQLGSYYNTQNQDLGYQQAMSSGMNAGALPQWIPAASYNQNSAQSNVATQTSVPGDQPSLNQTVQDFGYLNNCFQTIKQQGNSYFQMGINANDIFNGAGQALVKCYNDSITARTEQLKQQQTYQSYLYQQNYINQMYAIYQALRKQQAGTAFTIAPPPGVR